MKMLMEDPNVTMPTLVKDPWFESAVALTQQEYQSGMCALTGDACAVNAEKEQRQEGETYIIKPH